jgi:hypothetical protein
MLAQPSLMPKYSSPASAGAHSFSLYKVRDFGPGEQPLNTVSNSSFDFFQIGHTVMEMGELDESGVPM